MNLFKSLGVLLLFTFIVGAYCDYEGEFNEIQINLNNIYPELGESIEISIYIEGAEYGTERIRVFLDEGYYTQMLIEDEIYISKGENLFIYEIKVPMNMAHNVGFVTVEVGSYVEEMGIIFENYVEESVVEMESLEEYFIKFPSEKSVRFRINTNGKEGEIVSRSVNGTVSMNVKKCEDCEMIVSFEYMGEDYNIYNKWGEYVKPYTKISKIENNEVVIVSCPSEEIEKYEYYTGYEKFKGFDLSKFNCEEMNEIVVVNENPLIVLIKAEDELNRKVKSKGELILECDINNYMYAMEFEGEKEVVIDLGVNATCNLYYGDAVVNDIKLFKREIIESEIVESEGEINYITYGLIVIIIVLMGLLLYKWGGLKRK